MWILFTRALTAATSSTRVSILNTAANFITTAILGMVVFGEKLPLLWWLGASLLISGSVVIGARDGDANAEEKQNREDAGSKITAELASGVQRSTRDEEARNRKVKGRARDKI